MQEWLTQAERYPIERIQCPHPNEPIDMSKPPMGVLHTTEGGWDGSMSVFRKSSAPHFMVGRDRVGKVRLAQLVPLGKLACALENDPGGIETNRWVRAQVELVGYSKQTPWKPDPKVADALGALMRTLLEVCQIPLSRPFGDATPSGTWATESNSHRRSGVFGSKPGWYGHIDLPENCHWDPGALQWSSLFARREVPLEKRVEFQAWARWHLSGRKTQRPACVPKEIPPTWWNKLKATKRKRPRATA